MIKVASQTEQLMPKIHSAMEQAGLSEDEVEKWDAMDKHSIRLIKQRRSQERQLAYNTKQQMLAEDTLVHRFKNYLKNGRWLLWRSVLRVVKIDLMIEDTVIVVKMQYTQKYYESQKLVDNKIREWKLCLEN